MPIIDTNRIRHMDMSHDTDFRSDVKFDLIGCSGLWGHQKGLKIGSKLISNRHMDM